METLETLLGGLKWDEENDDDWQTVDSSQDTSFNCLDQHQIAKHYDSVDSGDALIVKICDARDNESHDSRLGPEDSIVVGDVELASPRTGNVDETDAAATSKRQALDDIKREARERKATKSDDAEIPT
jgi:hypothetical protein